MAKRKKNPARQKWAKGLPDSFHGWKLVSMSSYGPDRWMARLERGTDDSAWELIAIRDWPGITAFVIHGKIVPNKVVAGGSHEWKKGVDVEEKFKRLSNRAILEKTASWAKSVAAGSIEYNNVIGRPVRLREIEKRSGFSAAKLREKADKEIDTYLSDRNKDREWYYVDGGTVRSLGILYAFLTRYPKQSGQLGKNIEKTKSSTRSWLVKYNSMNDPATQKALRESRGIIATHGLTPTIVGDALGHIIGILSDAIWSMLMSPYAYHPSGDPHDIKSLPKSYRDLLQRMGFNILGQPSWSYNRSTFMEGTPRRTTDARHTSMRGMQEAKEKAMGGAHRSHKTKRALAGNPQHSKAKKKATRKKTPPYQLLINRCQKLWTSYCDRPSKKRLEALYVHLDKMKDSTSKKVATERSRCLRAANAEAKKLKYKRKK